MTLFFYRNPYRHPSSCPRHPIHSVPCPWCDREKKDIARENALEIESTAGEDFQADELYIRDINGIGTGEDVGES